MVTKKNGKLLFFNVLSVLIVLGFMLGFVTNAEEVTDYKKMPPPEGMGIIKPTTGFKFHIESKDGEVTEQWTRGEFSGSINVKVGDKVTVTDWSGINTTGASLKMWDYQKVLPSGQEIVQEKSASLNGVIDSFTVTQEGHYEFYIAVSDTGGQELGWDNWSQNGSHTAIKVRNGKEYKWYFVRLDMDAEKETENTPDTLTVNGYDNDTGEKIYQAKYKITKPVEVTPGKQGTPKQLMNSIMVRETETGKLIPPEEGSTWAKDTKDVYRYVKGEVGENGYGKVKIVE